MRLENYGYQNYDVEGISFPHNVLRNAARTGVLTEYVLLVGKCTMRIKKSYLYRIV